MHPQKTEPITLPSLPYAYEALEPHIDARTMQIHHTGHHAAYVNNLNKALESAPDLKGRSVEELLANNLALVPENLKTAVRNIGGSHAIHSMLWTILGPNAGGNPVANQAQAIDATIGGYNQSREKFNAAAAGRIGS